MAQMIDARAAIKALGGVAAVARLMGWPITTTQYYWTKNRFPPWREQLISEAVARAESAKA